MKDKMEKQFESLKGQFDTEEPRLGHFDRFQVKLNKEEIQSKPTWNPATWKWIAVAASITLLIGFWLGGYSTKQGLELADISPEMEETQSFFVSTIENELIQVQTKRNEDNSQIIDDALAQLKVLEGNHSKLTIELESSNGDRRIIYAMISNYQQRIEILQTLLQQIDELQQLKTISDDEKII